MPIQSTRKRMTVEQRREEVTFRFLAGVTMRELAKEYGVNKSQISRDLKAVRATWAERYSAAIDEQKRQELAKIDHLERTYWRAWEDSKIERVEQSTGLTASGGKTATMRKIQRDGDPRYLDGVRWCISERCKIYGLYAAAKQEYSGANGGPIATKADVNFDYSKLSTEQLAQLVTIAESVTSEN